MSQQANASLLRILKSKSVKSTFAPLVHESEIQNTPEKKFTPFYRRIFRRKNGEYVVSEVNTSASGETRSRIRDILKTVKKKWDRVRPSIAKIVYGSIGMVLLTVTVRYSLSKFSQHLSIHRNLKGGNHLVACILPYAPKRDVIIPTRLIKPALPLVAPNFGNGVGSRFWAQSGVSLSTPQSKIYQDVVAQQFKQHQINKVLVHRGGELLTPEMWLAILVAVNEKIKMAGGIPTNQIIPAGWASYLLPFVSVQNALYLMQAGCYVTGYRGVGKTISIFATLTGFIPGVSGFSVNPGNQMNPSKLGTFENPITRMDQINHFNISTSQKDQTLMGGLRNATDLFLGVSAQQLYKKRKHFANVTVPAGEKAVWWWARHVMSRALHPNSTLYKASFNENHNMSEPSIVTVLRNTTHILADVFIIGPAIDSLDQNFTLSPADKAKLMVLRCAWRTGYNMSPAQFDKLINEGRVQ